MSRTRWILVALTIVTVSMVSLPSSASTVTYYPRSADPTPPKESVLRFAGGKPANKVTVLQVGGGIAGCLGFGPGSCGSTSISQVSVFDSATNVKPTGCTSTISRQALCPNPDVLIIDLQGGDDSLALLLQTGPCVTMDYGCRGLGYRTSINGGTGNDSLRTLNLLADTVTCGDGVDAVVADGVDNVAGDCENVTRI